MKILLLMMVVLLLLPAQSFKQRVESYLKDHYSSVTSVQYLYYKINDALKKTIQNDNRQLFFRPSLHSWSFIDQDSVQHYAVLDNVIGKVQPITFIMIFDQELNIKSIDVLKYREAYGYEVKYRSFLDQFTGKNRTSGFEIGKDIRNISGATLSVASMCRGIRKLTQLISHIKQAHHAIYTQNTQSSD